MVALEGSPTWWATRAVSSHLSESDLAWNSSSCTRSLKTSAPPPGSASTPASFRSSRISAMDFLAILRICSSSIMVKALSDTPGRTSLIALTMSR